MYELSQTNKDQVSQQSTVNITRKDAETEILNLKTDSLEDDLNDIDEIDSYSMRFGIDS